MTDLTPVLNDLLKGHDARPTAKPSLTLQKMDGFIKEAHTINSHIANLNTYLKNIRESYLSTATRPLRASKNPNSKYLTDRDREEIDATTKQSLRELNASIGKLTDAETLRQDTENAVRLNKYGRLRLGALGKWAAGGAGHTKSFEQELEEAKANAISVHRENVLWYLREKLRDCVSRQASMMEKRLDREVEKKRNVLRKSRAAHLPEPGGSIPTQVSTNNPSTEFYTEKPQYDPQDELSEEQIQMFEKDNQDMLKHYTSTLNQISTAEKSLIEISELQNQLVANLNVQSAHIEHLVLDSEYTAENIGGGNKQLKKAAERKSTAKYVFYASCGLSLFLVVWDLII